MTDHLKVIDLKKDTARNPDIVLQAALTADLTDVVVIGHEADGAMYLASSHDFEETIFQLVRAQHRLNRLMDALGLDDAEDE